MNLTRLLNVSSIAALLLVGCGGSPTAPSASDASRLDIKSPSGELIGRGQDVQLSGSAARFQVHQPSRGAIQAFISPNDNGPQWQVFLSALDEQDLEVATYESTERYAPGHPTRPRLSVNGNGMACDGEGRFTISRLTFDGTVRLGDGSGTAPALSELVVSFEHRCREAAGPGLSGTLVLVRPAPML